MITRPKLPTTYSATVQMPGGRIEKRFVTPGKHRIESVNDAGRPIITIRREDKGVVWVIHPHDMVYFEQKVADMDKMLALLFPPLNLKWSESEPLVIDGGSYKHFHGVGTSRHGPTEEHIYLDALGMFRRETCLINSVAHHIEYLDVSLGEIPPDRFEFDKKGYKKERV
jgi:hypothetical protein